MPLKTPIQRCNVVAAMASLAAGERTYLEPVSCNGLVGSRHLHAPYCIVGIPSHGRGAIGVMQQQNKRQKNGNLKLSVRASSAPPYNVLVTGSTKGIGNALAEEFLKSGDNVIICSRTEEHVQHALQKLRGEYGDERSWGKACDVRDSKSIKELVAFAKDAVGRVDIWINNAGSNGYSFKPLVETNDDTIMEIVETNLIGVMLCCREAITLMKDQPSGGHIFNMDGAGADGRPTPRFAAYGATKRSITQFTKTLQAELSMQGVKSVIVHSLSPGMVTTDLLMSGTDTKQAKFFINALAEPPSVVAEYLVPRIRAVVADKNRKSTYIRFLTELKAYSQILSRVLFKTRKDRFVQED